MKKFVLMTVMTLLSLCVSAQVEVDSLSRLIVGDRGEYKVASTEQFNKALNLAKPLSLDPDAKICVIGKGHEGTGGRISFGSGQNAFIQQTLVPVSDKGIAFVHPKLELYGSNGVSILGVDYKLASHYSPLKNVHNFYCDVTVDGLFVNSDTRVKNNIEELTDSDSGLEAINPVSYTLTRGTTPTGMAKTNSTSDDAAKTMEASDRTRFGFIAQQVREVYPELVMEDENGYLSVDYIGFIPLLVDAVNNLSAKVKEQEEIIAELSQGSKKKSAMNTRFDDTLLQQNRPNPFNKSTVIECSISEDINEAALYIYDMQGKQLLQIPISARGNTSVTVEARQLGAGMYIYALIADGKEIDSRRMIVNN